MAGSKRAELASSSLEGSAFSSGYPHGQRGAYSGGNLDRSGSFREGLEAHSLASCTGTPRNAEVPVVSQYINLEPVLLFEQKYTRYNELRRVLGVSLDEQHLFGTIQSKPLPSTEEVRRFRLSLQEQSSRARDRRKLLNDSLLKLDKFRNVILKKQRPSEVMSSGKSGNPTLLKMGGQIHPNPLEIASQRPEERVKNGVRNKRARSSVAEVRSEGRGAIPMRSGMVADKDKSMPSGSNKNMLRTCNGAPLPFEDKVRGLPTGGDVWEKKLKRKRSVGTMLTRTPAGELKQPILQRPISKTRSRSCDGLGFRPASSTGIPGANKIDPSSQLSGSSSRASPRNDMDNPSLPGDRRERFAGQNKERILAKGSYKLNTCEDAQVGGQNPLPKGKASRAPQTGSGFATNTASNFPHSSGGIDGWEQPSSLNKVQILNGMTNRKRPLPTGSSSPPVAQWVGQRPQKISRTRRAKVVSPVSNFDGSQISSEGCSGSDVGSRLAPMESSVLLASRGMPNNSHQLKLKIESVPSPLRISESEESGATENKPKAKGSSNREIEDVAFNAVHGGSPLTLPTKKSEINHKEELGDGIRRQGRSGRGSIQSKGSSPMVKYKPDNGDTGKPLKSRRPGFDKSESGIGRPPLKKASDRKAYIRSGRIMSSGSSETTGESDDDLEELEAAASFAHNASYTKCSSSFWKKVEPIFASVGSDDIKYVKHQISFSEELDESLGNMLDADHNGELACQPVSSTQASFSMEQQINQPHMVGLKKYDEPTPLKTASKKLETVRWFEKIIPLSERLLSAFIAEDGSENVDFIIDQGETFLQFSSDSSPYGMNSSVENEQDSDFMKSELQLDVDFKYNKHCYSKNISCNGYTAPSNLGSPNTKNFSDSYEMLEGNDLIHADSRDLTQTNQNNLNQLSLMGLATGECQFEHMSLDDRILIELHSIGLYPEAVPNLSEGEDEEILKVISQLKIRLCQQAREKKKQLFGLEKAIQVGKGTEERNLEQLAMNKLVEAAYKKLTGGRGTRGSSHKSRANKISKHLALAFAKRTLVRCKTFEETGRSCFTEPALRDVILSQHLYNSDAKSADDVGPGIAANEYVDSHSSQRGSWVSGVTSTSEGNAPSYKVGRGQMDLIHGLSHISDQTVAKNDQMTSRGKKREVLLDDVVMSAASRAMATLSHTSPGGAKWIRTDKDRVQNKDILTRNSSAKAARPTPGSGRDRKTKTKSKQKIAQLSTSGNGLGRVTETSSFVLPLMPESSEAAHSGSSRKNQEVQSLCSVSSQYSSKEIEDSIFTNLPVHGIDTIDELDVEDGLGGQGQDIASWLNVDEDSLQGHDFVGLEIPMDDLSDLKLNF